MDPALWQIEYAWEFGFDAVEERALMNECRDLYSSNYGRWGERGPHPGARIRLPDGMLEALLEPEGSWIAYGHSGGALVGYATGLNFEVAAGETVAWVSQLVVAEVHRKSGVATRLLLSAWHNTNCFAWGLATANPFAVRALETATRRRCETTPTTQHSGRLLAELSHRLRYIPGELSSAGDGPCVDTRFYVDHAGVPDMIKQASVGRPWNLGQLADGEEWLACTFHSQEPEPLSEDRLKEVIDAGGDSWVNAYERMSLSNDHTWRKYTDHEVDAVLDLVELGPGARVLDVGCGDGRHTVELARRGFHVTGIDASDTLVGSAATPDDLQGSITWQSRDARGGLFDREFELAVCLYDVVGSSGDREDDVDILINIHDSLVVGGRLVLGVMNVDATQIPTERRPTNDEEFAAAWEALPASDTMHTTGAVFDAEFILVYNDAHYRKEQFPGTAGELPTERAVRDKRYTVTEITSLIEGVGFELERACPVALGDWLRRGADDSKEILVVARRVR